MTRISSLHLQGMMSPREDRLLNPMQQIDAVQVALSIDAVSWTPLDLLARDQVKLHCVSGADTKI